jgi:hypothetical protein
VLAREHLVAGGLYLCLTDQGEQGVDDGLGDEVFGVVDEKGGLWTGRGDILLGELGEAGWVLGKEVPEDEIGLFRRADLLQLLPRRVVWQLGSGGQVDIWC